MNKNLFSMKNIMHPIQYFHHIHHCQHPSTNTTYHKVEHCGNAHAKIDKMVDYTNEHCIHGKHRINKRQAYGHDMDVNPILFTFHEKCGNNGWHIESGTTDENANDNWQYSDHKIYHTKDMKHMVKHNGVEHCEKHKRHLLLNKSGHVHLKEAKWFC